MRRNGPSVQGGKRPEKRNLGNTPAECNTRRVCARKGRSTGDSESPHDTRARAPGSGCRPRRGGGQAGALGPERWTHDADEEGPGEVGSAAQEAEAGWENAAWASEAAGVLAL